MTSHPTNRSRSTCTSSTDARISLPTSPWKDLPYRLGTICIGVPTLWNIWCHDTLRVLSFYVIHILCVVEYIYVITIPTISVSYDDDDDNDDVPSHSRLHLLQRFPLHRHVFVVVSWLLLYVPTPYFIPLVIVTLALVSILIITNLRFVQQPSSSSSSSSSSTNVSGTTPPATTVTSVQKEDTYRNMMIIWFHGILFITLPFRLWIAVTSAGTYTATDMNDDDNNRITTTNMIMVLSGFRPTISLLFTVWNCDTGALFFGRCFGRRYHPPSPNVTVATVRTTTNHNDCRMNILPSIRQYLYHISPSKSLEGLMGGVLCGTLTYAYLLPIFWYWVQYYHISTGSTTTTTTTFIPSTDTPYRTTQHHHDDSLNNDMMSHHIAINDFAVTESSTIITNIGIGLLLSISAIVGDILESSIKRYHHCKDSGSVLPGHGGIYDRFDSSLISVVLYHYCVLSFGHCSSHHNCAMILHRGY